MSNDMPTLNDRRFIDECAIRFAAALVSVFDAELDLIDPNYIGVSGIQNKIRIAKIAFDMAEAMLAERTERWNKRP